MKISFLGPKGTFSYMICKKYCNDYYKNNGEMIEAKTIVDAITMLENGEVDKAIVPVENSIQGSVSDTFDTLIKYDDIFVSQELILDITQNLMSQKNLPIENIERIYSHYQAISQCREYLNNHGLYEKVVTVESTAKAAQIVASSNENIACIGSKECAQEYSLTFIEESIQDNDSNKTRFWVLSKENNIDSISESMKKKEIENKVEAIATHKKMSMVFSVANKPGALFEVLKIFNEHDLNLTKIESRPAKTGLGEYIFYIDVDIKPNYVDAIDQIRREEVFFRILGIYD